MPIWGGVGALAAGVGCSSSEVANNFKSQVGQIKKQFHTRWYIDNILFNFFLTLCTNGIWQVRTLTINVFGGFLVAFGAFAKVYVDRPSRLNVLREGATAEGFPAGQDPMCLFRCVNTSITMQGNKIRHYPNTTPFPWHPFRNFFGTKVPKNPPTVSASDGKVRFGSVQSIKFPNPELNSWFGSGHMAEPWTEPVVLVRFWFKPVRTGLNH